MISTDLSLCSCAVTSRQLTQFRPPHSPFRSLTWNSKLMDTVDVQLDVILVQTCAVLFYRQPAICACFHWICCILCKEYIQLISCWDELYFLVIFFCQNLNIFHPWQKCFLAFSELFKGKYRIQTSLEWNMLWISFPGETCNFAEYL